MIRISLLALVATFVLTAPAAGQPPPNTPPTVPQDADSDGFLDASDQCPSVRGTVNGCPDTDSDGDGFGDTTDPCPAVSGLIDGCFTPPPPPSSEPAAPPTATSVATGSASLRRSGGALMLAGVPFSGAPQASMITPRRLTIWLPKGIKVSGAPAKPCTEAFARTLTLDNHERCAKILAGRLGGEEITAWFAYAGPKQGAKQRLWLRGRSGDDLVGFGKGWIEPAKGAFRTKITLELGQLGITTRGLEVFSAPERATAGMVKPFTRQVLGQLQDAARHRAGQGDEDLPLLDRDAPEGEPALELGLDRQVGADLGLQPQLALVVALLRAARGHERVEAAALVVVDPVDPLVALVARARTRRTARGRRSRRPGSRSRRR